MKFVSLSVILLLTTATCLLAQYNGGAGSGTISETITAPPDVRVSYPGHSFCTTSSPVNALQTGPHGGKFSFFPAGLTLDTITGVVTPGISTIGTYTIVYSLVAAAGCSASDTTTISIATIIRTTQDPVICQGDTFSVGTKTYTTSGTYSDTLTSGLGCDSIVTTNLNIIPRPVISLGNDTMLCRGHSIILTPGTGFSSYMWSDSSTLSTLLVTEPGRYSVTVFQGLCSASDSLFIDNCSSELWIPNAFTPDEDGKNDRFKPVSQAFIRSYQVVVFDRWGQQVYESNDILSGWDGTYKGKPCPEGVYLFKINYSTGSESAPSAPKEKRGTITILRK